MTLDVDRVANRLAAAFLDIERIGEFVLRFTRRRGDYPFAVYYVDLEESLPETSDALTRYQDSVIGNRYFQGGKSLQWSNYLYFVISEEYLQTPAAIRAKTLIERDRNYARKFVVPEADLESILSPPRENFESTALETNVLSVWTDHLVKAGLDSAIFTDADLPTRLQLVVDSAIETPRNLPAGGPQVTIPQPIKTFELVNYRQSPRRREFDFGLVNLIVGANATGKTSLLEAIELFYCGRNKRNPSIDLPYRLRATFDDGRIEEATDDRTQQDFRNRNLAWYGQPEVKTNNLCLSFAQFNFLDTDAAVGLSGKESATRIEEDLSKLLIGPETSSTWRNIERVSEAVSRRLRELRTLVAQIDEELGTLEALSHEADDTPRGSHSLFSRLVEMVQELDWNRPEASAEENAGWLLANLVELLALAEQGLSISGLPAPISLESLGLYCNQATQIITTAEEDLRRWETHQKSENRIATTLELESAAAERLKELGLLIDAGLPHLLAAQSESRRAVAQYSGWLAGFDGVEIERLYALAKDATIDATLHYVKGRRTDAEASLKEAINAQEEYSQLLQHSENLSQQLHQIAIELIGHTEGGDECPLCHSRFSPGELLKRMRSGLDSDLEEGGQIHLSILGEREKAVAGAKDDEEAALWLKGFCDKSGRSSNLPLGHALDHLESARTAQAGSTETLASVEREIASLGEQGLSHARLTRIQSELHEFGFPLLEATRGAVDELATHLAGLSKAHRAELSSKRDEGKRTREQIAERLGANIEGPDEGRVRLSEIHNRLNKAQQVRGKLFKIRSEFPWAEDRPLAELAVDAESLRALAVELEATMQRERQQTNARVGAAERERALNDKRSPIESEITRLEFADGVFDIIKKKHSLRGAMEQALEANRTGIETIFSRIHSPAEFKGLGSTWTTLLRKAGGGEAKLTEVSTGQRAAFALSVFLAQNAQVSEAPPIMLIDDPIAYVDDLNSLSFLDYLREVSLTGARQIYFATANPKLATLFERKFDFLGDGEFCRIDLSR